MQNIVVPYFKHHTNYRGLGGDTGGGGDIFGIGAAAQAAATIAAAGMNLAGVYRQVEGQIKVAQIQSETQKYVADKQKEINQQQIDFNKYIIQQQQLERTKSSAIAYFQTMQGRKVDIANQALNLIYNIVKPNVKYICLSQKIDVSPISPILRKFYKKYIDIVSSSQYQEVLSTSIDSIIGEVNSAIDANGVKSIFDKYETRFKNNLDYLASILNFGNKDNDTDLVFYLFALYIYDKTNFFFGQQSYNLNSLLIPRDFTENIANCNKYYKDAYASINGLQLSGIGAVYYPTQINYGIVDGKIIFNGNTYSISAEPLLIELKTMEPLLQDASMMTPGMEARKNELYKQLEQYNVVNMIIATPTQLPTPTATTSRTLSFDFAKYGYQYTNLSEAQRTEFKNYIVSNGKPLFDENAYPISASSWTEDFIKKNDVLQCFLAELYSIFMNTANLGDTKSRNMQDEVKIQVTKYHDFVKGNNFIDSADFDILLKNMLSTETSNIKIIFDNIIEAQRQSIELRFLNLVRNAAKDISETNHEYLLGLIFTFLTSSGSVPYLDTEILNSISKIVSDTDKQMTAEIQEILNNKVYLQYEDSVLNNGNDDFKSAYASKALEGYYSDKGEFVRNENVGTFEDPFVVLGEMHTS